MPPPLSPCSSNQAALSGQLSLRRLLAPKWENAFTSRRSFNLWLPRSHAAKTLFATHYHELTELAERLPGAQNYQITATEREGEVVFLHRLERGRASKSYGIEVARLAGLPPAVLANAREVLERLERYELEVFADEESHLEAPLSAKAAAADSALEKAAIRAGRRKAAAQSSLFDLANQKVIDEIRSVSDSLSSDEAKELLLKLRQQLI